MVTPATKTETAEKVIEEAALITPVVPFLPVVVPLLPVVALLPVVLDTEVVEIVEVMVMVGRKFDGEMERPVVVTGTIEGAALLDGDLVGVLEIDCTHGLVSLPYSMINPATSVFRPLTHPVKVYSIVLLKLKFDGKPVEKKQTV